MRTGQNEVAVVHGVLLLIQNSKLVHYDGKGNSAVASIRNFIDKA